MDGAETITESAAAIIVETDLSSTDPFCMEVESESDFSSTLWLTFVSRGEAIGSRGKEVEVTVVVVVVATLGSIAVSAAPGGNARLLGSKGKDMKKQRRAVVTEHQCRRSLRGRGSNGVWTRVGGITLESKSGHSGQVNEGGDKGR